MGLYSVIPIILPSGERLPTLVDTITWVPVRLVTRWAATTRRLHVQSSTLADNLAILGRLYTWARRAEFDLDEYLVSGHVLDLRQLRSLDRYLQSRSEGLVAGNIKPANWEMLLNDQYPDATYSHHVEVIEMFLTWALYCENRGGARKFSHEQIAAERLVLSDFFESLPKSRKPSKRHEPLDDEDIRKIRHVIGPLLNDRRHLVVPIQFPNSPFHTQSQLRNWLMFETALRLGLRRGELLKLRLDCLPRGHDVALQVKRFPDDPYDTRTNEPAVKTAERAIPMEDELIAGYKAYLTARRPYGRTRSKSPYVFVTRTGEPVSKDTANNIINNIGRYSNVDALTWHRLRHTWAETKAEEYWFEPNGMGRLQYLGGWASQESVEHYTQRARAKFSNAALDIRQSRLYGGD